LAEKCKPGYIVPGDVPFPGIGVGNFFAGAAASPGTEVLINMAAQRQKGFALMA
jgi:hypothetical protein